MPIDLGSSMKSASEWAFGSALLNSILSSSIFVAIVIALLMMLIVMFMYPAKSGTPFTIVAKMFVYMFFGTLLVIFLHDGVVKYMMEENFSARDAEAFMQNTTMQGRTMDPSYADMYRPIAPQYVAPPPVVQTPLPPVVQQPPAFVASDTVTGGGRWSAEHPNRSIQRNPYS